MGKKKKKARFQDVFCNAPASLTSVGRKPVVGAHVALYRNSAKRQSGFYAAPSIRSSLDKKTKREMAREGADRLEEFYTKKQMSPRNGFGEPADKRPSEVVSKPPKDYITNYKAKSNVPDETFREYRKGEVSSVPAHKAESKILSKCNQRRSNVESIKLMKFEQQQLVNLLIKRKNEVAFELAELNSGKKSYMPPRTRQLKIVRLKNRIAMYNEVINDVKNQ